MPSEPLEIEELRRQVLARFGTIYAFTKNLPGNLSRSAVYMVLGGRYGGNIGRLAERIRLALDAPRPGVFDILKEVACRRCRKRRRKSRQCEKCFDLWRAQEKAVADAGLEVRDGAKKQDRPGH